MGVGRPTLGWAVPYLALVRLACGDPEAALEALRTSQRDARVDRHGPSQPRRRDRGPRSACGRAIWRPRWAGRSVPHRRSRAASTLVEIARSSLEVTLARVRLAQGKPDGGARPRSHERGANEASDAVADLISIRILMAAAADAGGSRSEALRALESAVRLAAPGGYVRRFVDDGGSVAHLLPLVRRAAPDFVDVLIAAFAAEPAAAPARSPRTRGPSLWQGPQGELLETLTARELEVLRLMAAWREQRRDRGRTRRVARHRQMACRPRARQARRDQPHPGARPRPAARPGLTRPAGQDPLFRPAPTGPVTPAFRQARSRRATPMIRAMERNVNHPKESGHV